MEAAEDHFKTISQQNSDDDDDDAVTVFTFFAVRIS